MDNFQTKDTDQGYEDIIRNMIGLKHGSVSVGLLDDGTMSDDGEMSIVDLAFMQNEGSKDGHIPSRNFMDETAISNEQAVAQVQTTVVKDVIDGRINPKKAFDKIGSSYSDMMKSTIDKFSSPVNAQGTIDNKRSGNHVDNPLVDTGKMRDTVSHRVNGKGA